MDLAALRGEQIHTRHRLPAKQGRNVLPGNLQALGLFERHGAGMVRRLFEHGSETEELTVSRFVDHHLLLVFIHGGHPDLARDHDVGLRSGGAGLVDALARRECLKLDLAGQYGRLLIIQQGKERNIS